MDDEGDSMKDESKKIQQVSIPLNVEYATMTKSQTLSQFNKS